MTDNLLRAIEALVHKPLQHQPLPHIQLQRFAPAVVVDKPKRSKRSKLNRYANTVAIDNLKEDVENYALHTMTVFYYQTSKGHWRIHLHGYGVSNDRMFLFESERMYGFKLLNCATQHYAGKLAKRLASDVGAYYAGNYHAFKGAK